jgi:hypothetical protein
LNDRIPIEKCSICRGTAAGAAVDWNFIPIPYFGNPANAIVKVATIGLNPAANEPRLPKLRDYGKESRDSLTDDDVNSCEARREHYFTNSEETWHNYFRAFESVLGRINHLWSYASNAVHIDLVACVTRARFGLVAGLPRESLFRNCRPHFLGTLAQLPSDTILLLDGEAVCNNVLSLGQAAFEAKPELVLIDPQVVGLRGALNIEGKQFKFRGWKKPSVSKLNVPQRNNLAIWLRNCC